MSAAAAPAAAPAGHTTAAERAELREMARELAHRELQPRAGALDAGQDTARAESWRALATVGLDRALLPPEQGGPGLAIGDLLPVLEELATGDGGMALCVLLANAALIALGDRHVPELDEGARWALVPVRAPEEAILSEGRLDGSVACALGAHQADGLVLAVPGPQPAAVALPAGTPGIAAERDEAQMGLRAAAAASLAFAAAEVDAALAGAADGTPRPDGASDPVGRALALVRAGTAAIARGIARRAYELACDYAHERHQGGVAIVEHDAVADMLGAMSVRLACPLPTPADAIQALALKIATTDAAVRSTIDAVQVFGGTGYMHDTGVEKLMRDAKYCQLFPEPNWVAQDELVHLQHAPAATIARLDALSG